MLLPDSVKYLGSSPTSAKVRKATDDNEFVGASSALISEITILTYSRKTLQEVTRVLKKRLSGNANKSSHKNAVHILKALTLANYLVANGSEEFVQWLRGCAPLLRRLKDFSTENDRDAHMASQIRSFSLSLLELLQNAVLLEEHRRSVVRFRSSISTPGYKSDQRSQSLPGLPAPMRPRSPAAEFPCMVRHSIEHNYRSPSLSCLVEEDISQMGVPAQAPPLGRAALPTQDSYV
ncbi:AaceriACL061Cp [[Ashbya] aceris (nom. inval.)]|nr:AaceriACL061Cp [[Ashbya] aceris (nom. inval.)]